MYLRWRQVLNTISIRKKIGKQRAVDIMPTIAVIIRATVAIIRTSGAVIRTIEALEGILTGTILKVNKPQLPSVVVDNQIEGDTL